ncbi:unnamed protein product [Closterium sp. NIES-54]
MTTLRVLLHVAAQRDYELHSLDFSTAFLQGSLHEEIWLRRPPGFTGSFPPGTKTTLAALGFAPSTADPSLFLRTDTSLPQFYILVYVDDLVFSTADTAGLAHVKSELQKRHTCTDLGELRSYLGLQITRDRAQRTITLTQSHMVQQVLQRFDFTYSSPQATPLSFRHSLSALPSDESVEPSGPYPELVGCLMYLMTCTQPDLAYPLSILARYVAPGRHRPEHMAAAKRVLRYLWSTSSMGLVLGGRRPVVLTGHADASWGDNQATQRSSQGAMAAHELHWLTYLLADLGEQPRSPPVLYVDNKAMLALCREHGLEHRTKHIALRYFHARELQQRGQLRLAYVASEANTADIFTKALPPGDHQRFYMMLGLHLPSFSTNLVSTAALQDTMVTTTTPGGQRVTICTCTRTGRHLATFTRRPGMSLYTLATEPPQVVAYAQVSASGQVAASCSCRLLSHQTPLWHHCLGHPSLPRLRGMQSRLLVSGLPRSLPPLAPSPAPPYLPCVEGRQRAAPHSSSFPSMTAPLQTLHIDVWGPARVSGQSRERYFLLVVDDYMRTFLFCVCTLTEVVSSPPNLLRDFYRGEGILHTLRISSTSGSCAFVRDTSADKLSPRAIPCVFLGFVPDAPGWQFYHPTSRRAFPSRDITLDESVPFYRLFPYRSAPPQPPPLFLAPGPPPVAVNARAVSGGAASGGAAFGGAAFGGADPGGAESEGAEPEGVEPRGAALEGAESGGSEPQVAASSGATGARGAGAAGAGGTGVAAGANVIGGTATTGPGGARTQGTRDVGSGGVEGAGAGDPTEYGATGGGGSGAGGAGDGGAGGGGTGAGGAGVGGPGVGGAGAGGARAVDPGGVVRPRPYFVPLLQQSQPPLEPAPPLPAPSRYSEQSGGLTERHEPASRPVSPVRTARRASCSRPPHVPGTHAMTLRPSTVPLRVPLPAPPESSLPEAPDTKSDHARAASTTVSRLLASAVTDPSFESARASALIAELLDFAADCCLDYTTALVAESTSASPPSVGGECALGTDVLEDRQEDFECLAAVLPRFASMLLAPEGDPYALDIPTPCSYAEAIIGPYSFQWQAAMDAEMASWNHSLSAPPSDESVEPSGPYPELVGCLMYLMTCTRPDLAYPLSLLARYVARGRHRKVHWDAAKRVLRYLCSASGMGLVLGGRGPIVLTGHADASWVDDSATQRSPQGYTFSLGSGSVSWQSTRSSSVLSSSCEAEIYAGAMAAQELRSLTYLLTDLGEQPRSPPVLYVDNKAMIALCQKHRLEHKTKHIVLR